MSGKIPPGLKAVDRDDIAKRTMRVLGRRLDYLGVRSRVDVDATGKWTVKIPELSASALERVRYILTRSGRLEFRRVSLTPVPFALDEKPTSYEMLTHDTRSGSETLFVMRAPEIAADMIEAAFARTNVTGSPEIIVELTAEGRKRFAEFTRSVAEEGLQHGSLGRIAIVVDGKLMTAPTVRERIDSDSVQITGKFSDREALDLAAAIASSLPVPVEIVSEQKF